MARSGMSGEIELPGPSRQLAFHELLAGARKTVLKDALRDAVTAVDPETISDELSEHAPRAARAILARAGVRDEEVFPVPSVLRKAPTLVGYYRLLLGASQKQFYASGSGTGPLKAMEERNSISPKADSILDPFCQAMCSALADLVEQLSPSVTPRDIDELPLLTLGSQFQGSNNNKIGQVATEKVFVAIKEIVSNHIKHDGKQEIIVENSAGRRVRIVLAADPDVRIEEQFDDGHHRPLVAMEIKGGTDRSNAHNRVGEAEKSHQKAKGLGFRDCWTIIAKGGLDLAVLESESPTSNSWFDAPQILGREGDDWEEFRSRLVGSVGIPA